MRFKSPLVDLYLCFLLFAYGIGGVIDGAQNEFESVAMFATMIVVCGFGLVAHFKGSIRSRMLATFGIIVIMIAESIIYATGRVALAVFSVAFLILAIHGLLVLWRGLETEKQSVRWIGDFDFPLSVVWAAQALWAAVLHLSGVVELPAHAPELEAIGIQYWGMGAIVFPLINLIGIARRSAKIRAAGAVGAGMTAGLLAILFLAFDPTQAGGSAVFAAFYVMSFFQSVRGEG